RFACASIILILRNLLTSAANDLFCAGLIHPFENGVENFFEFRDPGKGANFDARAAGRTLRVDIKWGYCERVAAVRYLSAERHRSDSLNQAPRDVNVLRLIESHIIK